MTNKNRGNKARFALNSGYVFERFKRDGLRVAEESGGGIMRQSCPIRNIERSARMNAAVGSGILRGDMMFAELILDDAAAFRLLSARETGPVDEKTLAADSAANVAAFMRKGAENLMHRGAS